MEFRKLFARQALLAICLSLTFGMLRAAEPADGAKEDPVAKQLKELKQSVDSLINRQKAQTDIDELKRQVALLRQDLDDVRKNLSSTRVSGYSGATAATGRVRLVNTYPELMTVVVNNKTYTLAPGEQ